eukprot:gene54487-72813_t
MKAVFFDRDGVLNRELGRYVVNADEFEVNDWVAPFMQPDSLMLEKAIAKYGVEMEKSFLIGDTDRDINAAAKVGLAAYQVLLMCNPYAAKHKPQPIPPMLTKAAAFGWGICKARW